MLHSVLKYFGNLFSIIATGHENQDPELGFVEIRTGLESSVTLSYADYEVG